MAARAGMATIVQELRRMCNVGTADSTVGGVTYWSDDQIQEVADRYRDTWKRATLNPLEDYADGTATYSEYPITIPTSGAFEEAGSASGWDLRDAAGSAAPAYTTNYEARVITLDVAGTIALQYFLDCRTYNLNLAAADIWEDKASFIASNVNWQSDNHRVEAGKAYEHYMSMAKKFRGQAGSRVVKMVRSDMR